MGAGTLAGPHNAKSQRVRFWYVSVTTGAAVRNNKSIASPQPNSYVVGGNVKEIREYTDKQILAEWDPENVAQWDNGGSAIAKHNLIWSVAAEHVGFSVWSLWSVMVLFMPADVYGLSVGTSS